MSEIDLDHFWDVYFLDKIKKTFPERYFDKARENTKFIVIVYNDNRAIVEMNIQTIDELEIMANSSLWKRLKSCSCKINAVKDGNDKVLVNKQNGNYREPAVVLEKVSQKELSWFENFRRLFS